MRALGIIGFIFFFCLFNIDETFAQKNFPLTIQLTDTVHQSDYLKIKKQITGQKNFSDAFSCNHELQQSILKLNSSGYLAASFDSVKYDTTGCYAELYLGEHYEWATLRKGNVDDAFLTGSGYRQKLYDGKPFRAEQIKKLQETIITNCENNGYPFATIKLDSISIADKNISARLNLTKNHFIKIDSVLMKGKAMIAPVYVFNYIGIKPGDVYNEVLVSRISNRIRELAFLQEGKPYRVLFEEKQTKLELYLDSKRASQFDGIVGVLPDNANPGKVNITGEAHLKLQNSLHRAEVIEFNWKQLPPSSQDLKVHFLYPFLLNTPFGLDLNLALFKKDTTYVDVTKNLGIQYLLTGNNYLKVFVNSKESSLLSTSGLQYVTVLPPYADITTTSYGIGIHYEKLDYRFNPRKGFSVEATASTGNRVITKNSDINPVLYDSLKLKTTQYNGDVTADYYFPLSKRQVIDVGAQSGYIYSPSIFTNELFRIGGLKSLRGFDEQSIYASLYGIGKIEYRYLVDQNSFLFGFFNSAYYENKSYNTNLHDTPYGFGAGMTFETRLGIMSVSYALGKQFNNPIYFRNGKIHFGIVNYF